MNFQDLVTSLNGTSNTNGWDAVCAYNATQLSAFCFDQFLESMISNPLAGEIRVAVLISGADYLIADMTLGPPDISFPSSISGPQCFVSMNIIRGNLIYFNSEDCVITNIIPLQNEENQISGNINLSATTGNLSSIGNVVLSLGDGAYVPNVTNINPDSILALNLGTAIQAFFQNNALSFEFGGLANNDNTPTSLQPTNFDFYCQPSPEGNGDGALLLLIQTNGKAGTVYELPQYPIPYGSTAALLVSNQVLFNQLFATGGDDLLKDAFNTLELTFNGQLSGEIYASVGNGGQVDIGKIEDNATLIFSCDSSGNNVDVVIPMTAFNLSAGGMNLNISWTQEFSQLWGQWTTGKWPGVITESVTGTLTWQQSLPLLIGDANEIIFGDGTVAVNFSPPSASWWREFIGTFDLSAAVQGAVQSSLQNELQNFKISPITTFTLVNLFFPGTNTICLQQAAIPGDLLSVGQINTLVQVSPAQLSLQEAEGKTFSVQGTSGTYNWELGGDRLGSIDTNGNYTAPPNLSSIGIDLIIATDTSNSQNVGYAMVTLLPTVSSNEMIASPAAATLTPGQSISIAVYGSDGTTSETVTWANPIVGSILNDHMGNYYYNSPTAILTPQTVTLTATSTENPQNTATITISLQISETVTIISPTANATLATGAQVILQASSSNNDITDFSWIILPTGQGTVTTDSQGTVSYTAPTSLPANPNTVIIAYYTGNSAKGIGAGLGISAIKIIQG